MVTKACVFDSFRLRHCSRRIYSESARLDWLVSILKWTPWSLHSCFHPVKWKYGSPAKTRFYVHIAHDTTFTLHFSYLFSGRHCVGFATVFISFNCKEYLCTIRLRLFSGWHKLYSQDCTSRCFEHLIPVWKAQGLIPDSAKGLRNTWLQNPLFPKVPVVVILSFLGLRVTMEYSILKALLFRPVCKRLRGGIDDDISKTFHLSYIVRHNKSVK